MYQGAGAEVDPYLLKVTHQRQWIGVVDGQDVSVRNGQGKAGTLQQVAGIANIFFQIPALSLAVSSMFMLLMAGLILYETQQIVRGGETNYIMATVTLFVAVLNLFTSLLHLLGFASQE